MARKKKEVVELPVIPKGELTKPIGQIAEECYTLYGSYVNNFRALANINDGCKVSYKRLIYMATKYPKGQDVPTHKFVSNLSEIHPHSTTGCEDLNANLVKSGVFEGHGFFGNIQIDGTVNPHAATRYTKNRLSDTYWSVIGDLIKEVPYVESPQGPPEPLYIPLVLPLCLYMKNSVEGLGVGINAKYPNFSPVSLYRAYIHNDPTLLEPNMNLIIDKEHSELDRLWRTGKGRVVYSYKISRAVSEDGRSEGILFEGDTGIFTPKIGKLDKLVEDGKIYIEDLTDENGPKLFIGRIPGARGITPEDIEGYCRKICFDPTVYSLNVTNGLSSFRIPLYDWLDYTYKNYVSLVTEVNKKRIEKCKFDILVQQSIPAVSDYILNRNPKATDEEISSALGLSMEVVSTVMSKPISYLRNNKDTSDRVKALKEKLKELKAFNVTEYIETIINKL